MRIKQGWLVAAAVVAGVLVITGMPLASLTVVAVVLLCPGGLAKELATQAIDGLATPIVAGWRFG